MKFIALIKSLFVFKTPLSPVSDSTETAPATAINLLVTDALLRAESEVVRSSKIIYSELLIVDDEFSHSQLTGAVKELIAIKEQLSALRAKIN